MTASHNLEDMPRKNVTLKHADTPQRHGYLSKTTQHHITKNGFTTYHIRHKECALALISAEAYCLRICCFSCTAWGYTAANTCRDGIETGNWYIVSLRLLRALLLYFTLHMQLFLFYSPFLSLSFSLSIYLSIFSIYLSFYNFLYLIFIYFYTHLSISL